MSTEFYFPSRTSQRWLRVGALAGDLDRFATRLKAQGSRANQAVAFAKMSRSSRRRRFSRRRRRSSSRSAVLGPSPRRPSSRSACTTQLRIACAVGSNSRDNSSGLRPARTNSTIWRRNSSAYGGLDLGMVDTSSPKGQVSTNSDQLQSRRRRHNFRYTSSQECLSRLATFADSPRAPCSPASAATCLTHLPVATPSSTARESPHQDSRSAERTAAPARSTESVPTTPSGCEPSEPARPPRRARCESRARERRSFEPHAGGRRATSPGPTTTDTPRTRRRPCLRSANAHRCEEALSRDPKPVLAPTAKPQYRCSCTVCPSR